MRIDELISPLTCILTVIRNQVPSPLIESAHHRPSNKRHNLHCSFRCVTRSGLSLDGMSDGSNLVETIDVSDMKTALGQPLLPYDVLLRVASFCSQSALASLTATNRDLYEACVLMLLDDPVELKDSKSVISFVDFLNSDRDTRWPRLHALIFGNMKLDEGAPSSREQILPLAMAMKARESQISRPKMRMRRTRRTRSGDTTPRGCSSGQTSRSRISSSTTGAIETSTTGFVLCSRS